MKINRSLPIAGFFAVCLMVLDLFSGASFQAYASDQAEGLLRFKVMSYNMRGCASRTGRKNGSKPMLSPINIVKPDLLGIQEGGCKPDLRQTTNLPHHEWFISAKGPARNGKFWSSKSNGLFSRWPFESNSVELPGYYKYQFMFLNNALVNIDGIPLSFYVTHLTNWGYSTWKGVVKEFIGETPRIPQVEKIVKVIKKDPYRFKVLVGDLNTVPMSAPWRLLSGVMEDAFSLFYLTGTRRTTWINVIRIDHIFASEDVQVEDAWVLKDGDSDHFPVAARMAIKTPKVEKKAATVLEVQNKLKKLGYFTAEPNGVMGRSTRQAISAYQANMGLPIDGCLFPGTLQALGVSPD